MPKNKPENMTTREGILHSARPLAQHVKKAEAKTKDVWYEQLNTVDTIFCI